MIKFICLLFVMFQKNPFVVMVCMNKYNKNSTFSFSFDDINFFFNEAAAAS